MRPVDHDDEEPLGRPGDAIGSQTTGPGRGESDGEAAVASADHRAWWGDSRAALMAHLATVAGALLVLAYFDRHQWFFGDDWDFIADRGLSHAVAGLWTPHNEHWSTLPILEYRALFTIFGVRTYLPYIAVLIVAHLLLAHLIWRLMMRVGVDPWVATVLVAVFLVLGAGYENLLWAFQIGFVGSVLFGYVALVLVDYDRVEGRREVALVWAALVVGLMCSGIGVTMVAVSGAAVVLRHGWGAWRKALVVVSVPAVVYVVWFGLAGHKGLVGDQQSVALLLEIPAFVWTGLTNAFGVTSGIPGAGSVLVVILAGWLVFRAGRGDASRAGRDASRASAVVALALGVVLMFVIIALGRTSLGVGEADAPRYVYLALALLLPVVGLALSQLVGTNAAASADTSAAANAGANAATNAGAGKNAANAGARWAVVGLVAFVVVSNVGLLRQASNDRLVRDVPLERQILAASNLIASGAPLVGTLPEPLYDPNITVQTLISLRRQGQLPTLTLSPADLLAASTQLQVALTRTPLLPGRFPPPTLAGASAVSQGGCIVAQPTMPAAFMVLRAPPAGATVQLEASAGGSVGVYLATSGGEVGPGRTVLLPAHRVTYLSVSAGDDSLTVYLPTTGTLQLCRLGP